MVEAGNMTDLVRQLTKVLETIDPGSKGYMERRVFKTASKAVAQLAVNAEEIGYGQVTVEAIIEFASFLQHSEYDDDVMRAFHAAYERGKSMALPVYDLARNIQAGLRNQGITDQGLINEEISKAIKDNPSLKLDHSNHPYMKEE